MNQRALVVLALCSLLWSVSAAHARLGETEQGIEKDRVSMGAARKTAPVSHDSYTVQELEMDSGRIREYVDTNGTVFAVAWEGRVHPDLSKLLGSGDFAECQQEMKKSPRSQGRRHHHRVRSTHITVEKWGHMRHLQGRAFLNSGLPAGVSADDIE